MKKFDEINGPDACSTLQGFVVKVGKAKRDVCEISTDSFVSHGKNASLARAR